MTRDASRGFDPFPEPDELRPATRAQMPGAERFIEACVREYAEFRDLDCLPHLMRALGEVVPAFLEGLGVVAAQKREITARLYREANDIYDHMGPEAEFVSGMVDYVAGQAGEIAEDCGFQRDHAHEVVYEAMIDAVWASVDGYDSVDEQQVAVDAEQRAFADAHPNRRVVLVHFDPETGEMIGPAEPEEPAPEESCDEPTPGVIVFDRADLSRATRTRWAWAQRLAAGYLNLLLGEEGIGKGVLVAWAIARLTRGQLPGDFEHQPVSVGIVGDEDDFDAVWTPRLAAAGADLSRVGLLSKPNLAAIEFGRDREHLAVQIREQHLAVVYFDAVLDHLGASSDANAGKDVREALRPIRLLARELGVVAWGAMHPNKRGSTFRELLAGSHQFNAVTRSGFLLAADPDDPERRVLVRGKGNLCPEPPGVEFTIKEHAVKTPDGEIKLPVADGVTESTWTRDDLLARSAQATIRGNDDDVAFLRDLLREHGGEIAAGDAYDAAGGAGIGRDRTNAAAHRLRVERETLPTFPRRVVWRLSRAPGGADDNGNNDNNRNSEAQSSQSSQLSLSSEGTSEPDGREAAA